MTAFLVLAQILFSTFILIPRSTEMSLPQIKRTLYQWAETHANTRQVSWPGEKKKLYINMYDSWRLQRAYSFNLMESIIQNWNG